MVSNQTVWQKYAVALSKADNFESLLFLITDFIDEFFNSDRGSIALLDFTENDFSVYTLNTGIKSLGDGLLISAENTLLMEAVTNRETISWSYTSKVLTGADSESSNHHDTKALVESGYYSCIVAPLVLAGKVLGVIKVDSKDPFYFKQEDKETLLSLASLVAAALGVQKYEEAIVAKDNFLAVISHELRTPLNAIVGTASILQETDMSGEQRKYLEDITMGADLLTTIINDVLDFSKIQAQQLNVANQNFNLSSCLNSIASMAENLCIEDGLEFKYNVLGNLGVPVLGDALRIQQILLNLISNAVKFTPEGSVSLDVSLRPRKEDKDHIEVEFKVTDTGIGIAKENHVKLFDPFYQVEDAFTRKFAGSGLGLSICQQLIPLMGGSSLQLESDIGEGAAFSFNLVFEKKYNPAHLTYQGMDPQTIVHNIKETGDKTKVLIVEDNLANQAVLMNMLKRLNVDVDIANNGKEACAKFSELHPQVILMDIQMPIMNGYEATSFIRGLNTDQNILIIGVSGNALDEHRLRGLDAGMDDFISKPFTLNTLKERFKYHGIINN